MIEVGARRHGRMKRAMSALAVGGIIMVPAYREEEHPAGRPAPLVYRYAKDYGYTLEVMGYAEDAGRPVCFLRRTA